MSVNCLTFYASEFCSVLDIEMKANLVRFSFAKWLQDTTASAQLGKNLRHLSLGTGAS